MSHFSLKQTKGVFEFCVSVTHNSVSITHNSKMVRPIAEKSVWFFITLFPVFVSITQFSDFWVMSYGNWKHILGVFSIQNSVFNGIFVIKPTSWDPQSKQHHTQALLLMGLLQRLFAKAASHSQNSSPSTGFSSTAFDELQFFFFFLFPFLFTRFLGLGYPFFFFFFSFLFTLVSGFACNFFLFSFLSFSRWFLGLVFVPIDYRHQTHSKIKSTKPIYPQISTKQSYGLSRICCFSSPFPPSTLLCQSQTHRRHCCVIVFFNKVFSDKCLWSFYSIFLFLSSFTHFFSHLNLRLNG